MRLTPQRQQGISIIRSCYELEQEILLITAYSRKIQEVFGGVIVQQFHLGTM
jgi:hypothetical protein